VRRVGLTVLNGIEQVCALPWLADVCVDEERVCLGVDVLHHDLETVEASRLWYLYLAGEALDQVLVDNAVGGSEEGEDVGDEEALVVVQSLVPVVEVLGQVDLLGGPEGSFGLLVHLPDLSSVIRDVMLWFDASQDASNVSDAKTYIVVLDWEKNEALPVLLEQWLVCLLGLDRGRDGGLCDRLLFWEVGNADDGHENIFLVRRREVKLLCRRVGHLERVNCSCSLYAR
jgi:hypothetical protein